MYFCRCSAFHRLPLELFLFLCVTRSSKNSCVVIDVDHYSYYAVNIVIFWCYSVLMYIVLLYTVVYTVVLLLIYTVVYTVVYTAYTAYTVSYCLYILLVTASYCLYILLILHHTAIHLQHIPGLWHQILFIAVIPALFQRYALFIAPPSSLLLFTAFNSCLTVV